MTRSARILALALALALPLAAGLVCAGTDDDENVGRRDPLEPAAE